MSVSVELFEKDDHDIEQSKELIYIIFIGLRTLWKNIKNQNHLQSGLFIYKFVILFYFKINTHGNQTRSIIPR